MTHPPKCRGLFITPTCGGCNSSSGQAFDSDIAAIQHLYPHLMASKQTHAHKRLRVGRIGLHGPYLSVPENGSGSPVTEMTKSAEKV